VWKRSKAGESKILSLKAPGSRGQSGRLKSKEVRETLEIKRAREGARLPSRFENVTRGGRSLAQIMKEKELQYQKKKWVSPPGNSSKRHKILNRRFTMRVRNERRGRGLGPGIGKTPYQ